MLLSMLSASLIFAFGFVAVRRGNLVWESMMYWLLRVSMRRWALISMLVMLALLAAIFRSVVSRRLWAGVGSLPYWSCQFSLSCWMVFSEVASASCLYARMRMVGSVMYLAGMKQFRLAGEGGR